jgi:hypothetical protein
MTHNEGMFKTLGKSLFTLLTMLSVLLLCYGGQAQAENLLQSSNYKFNESTLAAGGQIQSTSANFRASSSSSDLAVGSAASSNYQVAAGSQTTSDPRLAVQLLSSSASFGTFTPSSASTATASFSVLNYTSYGYVVQLTGNPPTNGSYILPGLSSNTASNPGIEQFGVNLVANTSPASIGANPANGTAPNDFGFGQASPNYATPNQYRYVDGETIALAPKSSGLTTYTISYIVNVKALTPGGKYTSNQSIVVTGTY